MLTPAGPGHRCLPVHLMHAMSRLSDLQQLIERFCSGGRTETPIPGVALMRSQATTTPIQGVYEPLLCVVAQGRKQVMLGDQSFDLALGGCMVVSVDLPVTGTVCEASAARPYLAFSLRLDPATIAELLLVLAEVPSDNDASPSTALIVSTMDDALLDPIVRLLRLLEKPRDIPILASLIEREILYRLLQSGQGSMLRQIAMADSRLSQVGRAIDFIRRHHAQALRIEELAQVARMSVSSLHRHFKAVTTMSPLQYQKRIRLQEARRLLMAHQSDAASVGFSVGYESPSQFSREYRRMFGNPPARDAARLRDIAGDPAPAT